MTGQVVGMIKDMFVSLLGYMQSIYERVDATGYIVAGFIICTIAALFIVPLRGSSLGARPFGEFTANAVSSARGGKYASGKWVKGNSGYIGKYSKIRGVRGNRAGK